MKVLVVVDMQNDFITGSLGTKEAQLIVPNIVKKIKKQISEDGNIVITYDTHFDNSYLKSIEGQKLPIKHCIKETKGFKLIDEISREILLYPSEKILPIEKYSFGSPVLGFILDAMNDNMDIDSIELVGLCTDICVISNAVILKSTLPNVPIIVDASCCAGSTPEAHEKALDLMEQSLQIDVINR